MSTEDNQRGKGSLLSKCTTQITIYMTLKCTPNMSVKPEKCLTNLQDLTYPFFISTPPTQPRRFPFFRQKNTYFN